ncbi:MAG: hypothetical protein ACTSYA_05600 [Candidatus Kariarchaeaceae archaeon]
MKKNTMRIAMLVVATNLFLSMSPVGIATLVSAGETPIITRTETSDFTLALEDEGMNSLSYIFIRSSRPNLEFIFDPNLIAVEANYYSIDVEFFELVYLFLRKSLVYFFTYITIMIIPRTLNAKNDKLMHEWGYPLNPTIKYLTKAFISTSFAMASILTYVIFHFHSMYIDNSLDRLDYWLIIPALLFCFLVVFVCSLVYFLIYYLIHNVAIRIMLPIIMLHYSIYSYDKFVKFFNLDRATLARFKVDMVDNNSGLFIWTGGLIFALFLRIIVITILVITLFLILKRTRTIKSLQNDYINTLSSNMNKV